MFCVRVSFPRSFLFLSLLSSTAFASAHGSEYDDKAINLGIDRSADSQQLAMVSGKRH